MTKEQSGADHVSEIIRARFSSENIPPANVPALGIVKDLETALGQLREVASDFGSGENKIGA